MRPNGTRLNLVRPRATELTFTTRVVLDDKLLQQIGQSGLKLEIEHGGFGFLTHYRRGMADHEAYAVVDRLEAGGDEFLIYMNYSLEVSLRRTKDVAPVARLLELLAQLGEQSFRCSVEFNYPADEFKSAIGLPMILERSQLLPFTEIRGVRVFMRDGDDVLYSVIVDHPTDQGFVHTVAFDYVSGFSEHLPGNILARAVEISTKFVTAR